MIEKLVAMFCALLIPILLFGLLFGIVYVALMAGMISLAALGGFSRLSFLYLNGRRNRDAGLACVACNRTAFPIEGTITRYRCWNCSTRFEGPGHF